MTTKPGRSSTLGQRFRELWLLVVVVTLMTVPVIFFVYDMTRRLTNPVTVQDVMRERLEQRFRDEGVPIPLGRPKTLEVLIWDGFFDEEVLRVFREIFGVRVKITFIQGNDNLERELKRDRDTWRAPYDLILPAQYQVKGLADLGIIEKLDRHDIPGRQKLRYWIIDEPQLDLVQEYSVPYFMGTVGLAYQRDTEAFLPIDWEYLFGDQKKVMTPRSLRNRTIIMEDMRFSLGSALIYLGEDPNSKNESMIEKAADLLVHLIQYHGAFLESEYTPEYLAQGEIDLAMAYSADPLRAFEKNPGIGFTNPLPGTILWIDCFAIVKGSPRAKEAAQFIEFLLDPRVAGYVTSYSKYSTTLSPIETTVTQFIDDEVRNGFSYAFPDYNNRKLLETLDPETRAIYQLAWSRVIEAARKYSNPPPRDDTIVMEESRGSAPQVSSGKASLVRASP